MSAESYHVAKTLLEHLAVLQGGIPLISAPLIVFLGNR
jgi:hypothetical protein